MSEISRTENELNPSKSSFANDCSLRGSKVNDSNSVSSSGDEALPVPFFKKSEGELKDDATGWSTKEKTPFESDFLTPASRSFRMVMSQRMRRHSEQKKITKLDLQLSDMLPPYLSRKSKGFSEKLTRERTFLGEPAWRAGWKRAKQHIARKTGLESISPERIQ